MKIAIVGSRSRTDRKAVHDYVMNLPADTIIVSGGCRGVDQWAEKAAYDRGLETRIFLPDKKPGMKPWEITKAFYARNRQIAEYADKVVAFVSHDRKGGTENTIKHAVELERPVEIVEPMLENKCKKCKKCGQSLHRHHKNDLCRMCLLAV